MLYYLTSCTDILLVLHLESAENVNAAASRVCFQLFTIHYAKEELNHLNCLVCGRCRSIHRFNISVYSLFMFVYLLLFFHIHLVFFSPWRINDCKLVHLTLYYDIFENTACFKHFDIFQIITILMRYTKIRISSTINKETNCRPTINEFMDEKFSIKYTIDWI